MFGGHTKTRRGENDISRRLQNYSNFRGLETSEVLLFDSHLLANRQAGFLWGSYDEIIHPQKICVT
jgi:hypothetical protein